ncbi:hypothetical protein CONLIGDRAFT_522426 [Coniochaeta ligniaria NRRL 30616]|uniref:Uncharacterized protein n=1 Tax=Coniochaeta ligniaria NRRL 30616 TaxID=1408157 RepID=A0A1J7IYM7_9PEZI|nr:hypothetical protein CONLIGDRAFT_522426 [Coniochaeta ligniaria NRRL 30616]
MNSSPFAEVDTFSLAARRRRKGRKRQMHLAYLAYALHDVATVGSREDQNVSRRWETVVGRLNHSGVRLNPAAKDNERQKYTQICRCSRMLSAATLRTATGRVSSSKATYPFVRLKNRLHVCGVVFMLPKWGLICALRGSLSAACPPPLSGVRLDYGALSRASTTALAAARRRPGSRCCGR